MENLSKDKNVLILWLFIGYQCVLTIFPLFITSIIGANKETALTFTYLLGTILFLILLYFLMKKEILRWKKKITTSRLKVGTEKIVKYSFFLMYIHLIFIFLINQFIEHPLPEIPFKKSNVMALAFIVICTPIIEEVAFRYALYNWINKKTNSSIVSIFITSFVFAFMHGSISFFIVYFISGVYLSFIYKKTKDLSIPILVHGAVNFFAINLQLIGGM